MRHRALKLVSSLILAVLFSLGAGPLSVAVADEDPPNCAAGTHWDKVTRTCVAP